MLAVPTGLGRSDEGINFAALCDWIEAGLLFDGDEMSVSDFIDVLLESENYSDSDSDSVNADVTSALSEIETRLGWIGEGTPLKTEGGIMSRRRLWQDYPAHSFCLALACNHWYGFTLSGGEYVTQGRLFERLTAEALPRILPGWLAHLTGWTPSNPSSINEVINRVSRLLKVEPINPRPGWVTDRARDMGIDVVCYLPFPDERVGMPTFFFQCASGWNWETKRDTPNLEHWGRVISFAIQPTKDFAMTFPLTAGELDYHCGAVKGLFLDRYRLLGASHAKLDWMSEDLKRDIVEWVEPRMERLPRS